MRAALLALALAGCASLDTAYYHWSKTAPACTSYVWIKVTLNESRAIMGNAALAGEWHPACIVWSRYSEEEAKHVYDFDGQSVYEHEHRHLNGETHREP